MPTWTRWLKPLRRRGCSRQKPARKPSCRKLSIEQLEDRTVPSLSLSALHLGSANGSIDYDYTAGNKVFPTGHVDNGKYYDLVVTRSDGTTSTVVPRTATNPFILANDYYTVLAGDPVSTATPYKFTIHEYANATTATILNSSTISFYVAQASLYLDTNGTLTPQSFLAAGTTAAVKVAGLQPSEGNWNTTWLLPDGSTVVGANTAGSDRPGTDSNGVLAAGSFLQYEPRPAPNTGSDVWNWQSNYETQGFQTFNSSNQGSWFLTLQEDNRHFLTLSVFTVDTTAPAAPTVNIPPGPIVINASNYTVTGTVTDNFQLALVQIWVDSNGDGKIDNGETVAGSQILTGTSASGQ
ncbi:MAG: hypothetical protein E6K70_23840 [Planctomycetota bacterium]|nr:MAG: hypothetical protein E6K70_23840 [Planctomycetota bacterium]